MTDQLRKLAETEAKNEFHPDRQPFNLYDARRSGYVRGFIAGRTSVTREQVAEVLCKWHDEDTFDGHVCLSCTQQAHVLIAFLKGENE